MAACDSSSKTETQDDLLKLPPDPGPTPLDSVVSVKPTRSFSRAKKVAVMVFVEGSGRIGLTKVFTGI